MGYYPQLLGWQNDRASTVIKITILLITIALLSAAEQYSITIPVYDVVLNIPTNVGKNIVLTKPIVLPAVDFASVSSDCPERSLSVVWYFGKFPRRYIAQVEFGAMKRQDISFFGLTNPKNGAVVECFREDSAGKPLYRLVARMSIDGVPLAALDDVNSPRRPTVVQMELCSSDASLITESSPVLIATLQDILPK